MYTTYVARQPILNAKRHTLGYELLFRDGETNAFPEYMDSDRATYRLIIENFLSMGRNPAISRSRCFINFPHNSLIQRLPLILPKEQIVVEVLETCEPTDELLEAIRELYLKGYLIALDDFVYGPEWERFLPFIHIVKLDIRALGMDAACEFVRTRVGNGSKRKFLAEKVETKEEFEQARSAGFKFFQGFFFSKPEMIKRKYISPEHVITMQLFKEVCREDVNFKRVEEIVAQDVALSYKLLRFVNSMSDRLAVPISSFRQALVYLGQDRLRIFVSLAVASYISLQKPKELYSLALQRAQFCHLMSRYRQFQQHQDHAFLIGLFSVLDALLDAPLNELIEELPLTDEIKSALVDRKGAIGALLDIEECYEQANWQQISLLCQKLGIKVDTVTHELTEALKWSQDIHRLV